MEKTDTITCRVCLPLNRNDVGRYKKWLIRELIIDKSGISLLLSRREVEILGKYQFWKRGNLERIALRYM